MGFNINEIVQSSKYRNFMKYLYGWGASVVLLGALFKLEHWTGASTMLIVGMSTEAIIFFFSAFEPVPEEVDWTIVYPELAGISDDVAGVSNKRLDAISVENAITSALQRSNLSSGAPAPQPIATHAPQPVATGQTTTPGAAFVFTQKFNDMLEKANVGPELFARVGTGLEKLSEASNGIGRISDAVSASDVFTKNMQRAGQSVGKFAESYEDSGSIISQSAKLLSESFKTTASAMGDDMARKVADASTTMASIQEKLAAINAAHEHQVQSISKSSDATDKVARGMEEMLGKIQKTIEDSSIYSQKVAALASNVDQLNQIYGNMLSMMKGASR